MGRKKKKRDYYFLIECHIRLDQTVYEFIICLERHGLKVIDIIMLTKKKKVIDIKENELIYSMMKIFRCVYNELMQYDED